MRKKYLPQRMGSRRPSKDAECFIKPAGLRCHDASCRFAHGPWSSASFVTPGGVVCSSARTDCAQEAA